MYIYIYTYIYILTANFIFIIISIFFIHMHGNYKVINTVTFSFSAVDSLLILYFALVISKPEYASVAWNSLADSSKLGHIQRKFVALCYSRFFQDIEYHCDNLLEKLNLQTTYQAWSL
jgi:hypothetical protein